MRLSDGCPYAESGRRPAHEPPAALEEGDGRGGGHLGDGLLHDEGEDGDHRDARVSPSVLRV